MQMHRHFLYRHSSETNSCYWIALANQNNVSVFYKESIVKFFVSSSSFALLPAQKPFSSGRPIRKSLVCFICIIILSNLFLNSACKDSPIGFLQLFSWNNLVLWNYILWPTSINSGFWTKSNGHSCCNDVIGEWKWNSGQNTWPNMHYCWLDCTFHNGFGCFRAHKSW